MVYVQNNLGQPLMPTEDHAKVRILLKEKKAVVVKRTPFTIRLTTRSKSYVQPVTLGVDAGSKTVGLSASTESKELFAAELKPRNDVTKKLETRREFRRGRRNRKRRYRQPRFNNRVHSKHKGWLAPSVEAKINNHLQGIRLITEILPVSEIRIETAEFDLQALKAEAQGKPKPQGVEYQYGEMFGFYNTRQYVLFRDQYTCRCCDGRERKFLVVNAESQETVSPEDSYTVCEECFKKYQGHGFPFKKRRFWRHPTFMGIMRGTLMRRVREEYPDIPARETAGAITKMVRENANLEKSHITDALCIAQHPEARRTEKTYTIRPVRRHNRQLHKATISRGGVRKANQAPREVFGFRLYDKVRYNGTECFVWARRTRGSFLLRQIDGTAVKDGVSYKKLTLTERSGGYLIA